MITLQSVVIKATSDRDAINMQYLADFLEGVAMFPEFVAMKRLLVC
jgi:hypothetical protein